MTDLDTALRAAEALRNISDQLNGNDARTFDESDIKAVIAHVDAQQKWAESLMRQVQYAIRRFEQAERERDALRAELDVVLSDWNAVREASGSKTNGGLAGHVGWLRSEVERLQAIDQFMQPQRNDAKRYRYLRSDPEITLAVRERIDQAGHDFEYRLVRGDRLDAKIDKIIGAAND